MGLLEEIESFRVLEKNWDGYGSDAIEPETVDLALMVARNLGEDWSACPGNCGTIQLERTIEDGTYHGIEITVLQRDSASPDVPGRAG